MIKLTTKRRAAQLMARTICVRLNDGRWLATEIHEHTSAIAGTKKDAEKAIRGKILANSGSKPAPPLDCGSTRNARQSDFYATTSAAELARQQGVKPIEKPGQIRGFSNPDPKEAEWLSKQVRRWRRESVPRTRGH